MKPTGSGMPGTISSRQDLLAWPESWRQLTRRSLLPQLSVPSNYQMRGTEVSHHCFRPGRCSAHQLVAWRACVHPSPRTPVSCAHQLDIRCGHVLEGSAQCPQRVWSRARRPEGRPLLLGPLAHRVRPTRHVLQHQDRSSGDCGLRRHELWTPTNLCTTARGMGAANET